ncbi:MAG: translation initiation factor IF-3 [Deltaproteobacteria bacterium]|nr:MAG: translation initiation factor IF-3 [Deltaproteobacteria bacterium]
MRGSESTRNSKSRKRIKNKYHKRYVQRAKEPRINKRIHALEVRLIGEQGEQLGVVSIFEALRQAGVLKLDLVEVSPMAKPPVCKIMDYGRFKYVQKKNASEAKKKQQVVELKEIQFRPKISSNDLDVKVTQIKKFISEGNKVKVVVFLKGREAAHPDIGFDMLRSILEGFSQEIEMESSPKMEGRQHIVMVISAKK